LLRHSPHGVALIAGALLSLTACTSKTASMNQAALTDFATRYAAAWSSQNPASLAAFYAEGGSLTVNGGAPSVGRVAITAKAQGFMTAFPDMIVRLDRVGVEGGTVVFRWIWTGTNTGPGGTGQSVRISGYEAWRIGDDSLIAESKGHYDEAEYQRQLKDGPPSDTRGL
jgi:predicted ester cyclase